MRVPEQREGPRPRVNSLRAIIASVARQVAPPVLMKPADGWRIRRGRVRGLVGDGPFDEQGMLWTALVHRSAVYGEWGMGRSSVLALEAGCQRVVSVDTSEPWVRLLEDIRGRDERFEPIHINLGPVGKWGRPNSYRHRNRIDDYLRAPLARAPDADLLLIDGRFRVACWATAMMLARAGTLIVFDDYVGRGNFHVVEEILRPVAVSGRQAVFARPEQPDLGACRALLADFRHVMD